MGNRLQNALKFSLNGEDSSLNLRNIKYLPRWVVFLIDIFLVLTASVITVFIIIDLTPNYYTFLNFPSKIVLGAFVHIIYFLVFRTYAGIIRYSSNIDALKLLLA